MTSPVEIGKLAELRQKTDRDLFRLAVTTLDRALILASVATTKQSPLYRQAENLQRQSQTWLSKIYTLRGAERAAAEARLLELRQALEQVPAQDVQCHGAGR